MEVLVGVAILAILLAVGVPSLRLWIMGQRVSAIGAELHADLQLARSESISRAADVRVNFGGVAGSSSCYMVYVSRDILTPLCSCTNPAACVSPNIELKTVSVPTNTGVQIDSTGDVVYLSNARVNAGSAALSVIVSDGATKSVAVTSTAMIGRPAICSPTNSTIHSLPKCGCPLPGRSTC